MGIFWSCISRRWCSPQSFSFFMLNSCSAHFSESFTNYGGALWDSLYDIVFYRHRWEKRVGDATALTLFLWFHQIDCFFFLSLSSWLYYILVYVVQFSLLLFSELQSY
jgi:hypothetical protein